MSTLASPYARTCRRQRALRQPDLSLSARPCRRSDVRSVERAGVRQEAWGGRQHYLQWANPATWRNWDEAGLAYDCTLAFSEAVGFRTGTCREYPVFDLVGRRPLDLRERPFQVMDVTLFGYMGLRPDAAFAAVVDIARACRRFRGDLGILWHNDEILRTARQKRWYAELIAAVTLPTTA